MVIEPAATDAGGGAAGPDAVMTTALLTFDHAGRRYQCWAAPGVSWDEAARACRARRRNSKTRLRLARRRVVRTMRRTAERSRLLR